MATGRSKRKSLLEGLGRLPWQVNLALMFFLFFLLTYLPVLIEVQSPMMQTIIQAAPNLALVVALLFLIFSTLALIKRYKAKKYSVPNLGLVTSQNLNKQELRRNNDTSKRSIAVKDKDSSKTDRGKLNEVIESSFFIHTSSINIQPNYMSLELIQNIEWKRFEELCKAYIESKGGQAKTIRVGTDGGVDIELYKDGSDRPAGLVQCKAWNSKVVGVEPISEFYSMMTSEGVEHGIFIITHIYTQEAIAFAKGKKLLLLSGNGMIQDILSMPEEKQAYLLEVATEGDYLTPTCPNCDIKLVERKVSRGENAGKEFWGCKNYPTCKHKSFVKVDL